MILVCQNIILKMEEIKKEKIFMLWETLDQKFNPQQWTMIKVLPPHIFNKIQEGILEQLMHDQKLYNRYFKNFYSNHVKIFNWFMLATDKKNQIQPYIFKTLVNNGMMFYNQKIKEVFEGKFQKVSPPRNSQMPKDIQNMQQQVYRDFFNDLLNRNRIQHNHKPLNLKLYGNRNLSEKDNKKMDGHDFYIQTFNACNGWKYIFYNYQKHMQGLSQKFKYNEKIRQRDKNSNLQMKQQTNMKLTDFQHEQLKPQKCRVEKMSQIFANKTAQSAQQLRKLARKENIKKIVFINHQGKPSTYLISSKNKKRI